MLPATVIRSFYEARQRHDEVYRPEPKPQVSLVGTPADAPAPVRLQSPTVTSDVQRYIQSLASNFLTPAQHTSNIIAAAIKHDWKIDIDPDKARIATFDYEIDRPKPAQGKLLNSITLTDAALKNLRHKNGEDETAKGPRPWWLKALDVVEEFSPLAIAVAHGQHMSNVAHAHEYIIPAFNSDPQHAYKTDETLSHRPQAFRDLIWQTELNQPYKAHLDTFWPANQDNYTQCSKFAFASAAQIQHQEGSLSNYETSLVMRAAGFGAGSRLSEMTVDDLKARFRKDPDVETGVLSINGYPSTDLLYVTDKRARLNAQGKKINHTLLYIPGNSSPIHRFDSVAQMKTWLADQGGHPQKRAQLSTHFSGNAQDDKVFSDGVKQALTGLGGWSEAHKPNAWGFESPNGWDPQVYITTEPVSDDPFAAMTQRQKARSYADAAHDIVTDSDVIKGRLVNLAEAATTAALMLTPMAMIIPEVAVAVEAAYVAAGVAEFGIGLDDAAQGKSTATDRTVFGLLNAAPVLLHIPSRLPSLSDATADVAQAVAPANKSSIEFDEVFDSNAPAETTQVVELAGDAPPSNSNKRVRLDETHHTDGVKRSKTEDEGRDLNRINDLVFTFVDTYNGAERLNIVAHGVLRGDGAEAVADAVVGDVVYDASELVDMLWDNDVPTEKYSNIRLLMCDSGTGGERSFAAQFQEFVDVPVKAYAGKVTAQFTLDDIAAVFEPKVRARKLLQFNDVLPAERRHRVIKHNPYSGDVDGADYSKHQSFRYDPVHFPPRSEAPKPVVVSDSMPQL